MAYYGSRRPPPSWLVPIALVFVIAVGAVLHERGLISIPTFNFGTEETAAAPPPPVDVPGNDDREKAKNYARLRLAEIGQADQFDCLDKLWTGESGWNASIKNKSSGAYGIPQIHPGVHGYPVPLGDWRAQVDWGLTYIGGKYGTPCVAWEFWQRTDLRCPPKTPNCSRKFGGHWY